MPLDPLCPACGAKTSQERAVDPAFVRCPACGLLFRGQKASPAELEDLNNHRLSQHDHGDDKPNLDFRFVEPEMTLLRQAAGDRLAGWRALDVGTALGDFTAFLDHHGLQAIGLEPSAPRAAIGRAHGLDVRNGRFSREMFDREFAGERFDLISFRECLYYMDDYTETLSLCKQRLTPRGFLYIRVHVAESPHYWRGIPLTTRIGPAATVFFTRSTLIGMLNRNGFSVVTTHPVPLSPGHAVEA